MSRTPERIHLSFSQTLRILAPYVGSKLLEQIKTLAFIVLYLIAFQLIILGIPIHEGWTVSLGIGVVVLGLAFFMEGLFLGLMPLGETCGIQLPQKARRPFILLFAFVLGVGATFAEPAIGVLRAAGASVKAWDAPLLYLLLNKHAESLVWAVGIGVGIAVLFGMLRFLYGWSLKPFIYILYAVGGGISLWAYFDPNLVYLLGLAWDCGAVTTGPVTVPLVLALGIGISRAASPTSESDVAGGFGVVTLASAFPILAVLGLGLTLVGDVPRPMDDTAFTHKANRECARALFANEDAFRGYVLRYGSPSARLGLFDNDRDALERYLLHLATNEEARLAAFGSHEAFEQWLLTKVEYELRVRIFGSEASLWEKTHTSARNTTRPLNLRDLLSRNSLAALQAILPLSLLLLLVLLGLLRERLRRMDEVLLGILFAIVGMSLFNLGIEIGLSRLGEEIGANLPSSFKAIELSRQTEVIPNFDPSIVGKAITSEGEISEFFHRRTPDGYETLPYRPMCYDARTRQYFFTPIRGPLFSHIVGILVVIAFGFLMGYGATLAEPALNALGTTVEELTVGTFRKALLMQAVAIGVGIGIAMGVAKIIFDWPLLWLLLPPYIALILLTLVSSEDFVNIAWDSAGVTTGPVTVPLVLAMGLGISGQVGSIEGFGILALASAWPVLAVLWVGLSVTRRREAELRETPPA